MDIFSQVLLAVLVVMLGITALFVPYAIVRNLRQGLKFREALVQRADALRLGRMLRALGVDLAAYLHEQPLTRIEAQMRRTIKLGASRPLFLLRVLLDDFETANETG